jgi:hypothetical protein
MNEVEMTEIKHRASITWQLPALRLVRHKLYLFEGNTTPSAWLDSCTHGGVICQTRRVQYRAVPCAN